MLIYKPNILKLEFCNYINFKIKRNQQLDCGKSRPGLIKVFQEKKIWYVLCLDTTFGESLSSCIKKKKKEKFEVGKIFEMGGLALEVLIG